MLAKNDGAVKDRSVETLFSGKLYTANFENSDSRSPSSYQETVS
jgi:hypothetical protein